MAEVWHAGGQWETAADHRPRMIPERWLTVDYNRVYGQTVEDSSL
ncbi:MAG: hypothetical protein ACRDOA_04720 [Streptosporangiaceae bacterium]